jgi:integrase core domain protein
MFETMARRLKTKLKHIKPHTPKHNGKVERLHREGRRLFYLETIRTNRLITDEDNFKRRLKRYQNKTNSRAMRLLGYLSPKQYLEQYKKNKS